MRTALTDTARRDEVCGRRFLVVLFVLTLPLVNPYIRGDGNGYYSYVRSLIIDGDVHFANEYRRGDSMFAEIAFETDGSLRPNMVMPNNYVRNQWAVGPSLLWTPFFLTAHGLVHILNRFGLNVEADGYSPPYRWVCALGTAFYSFVGLLLAFQIATQLTNAWISMSATAGIWFASSLPVYMYFLPFHVPALAAFSVSLFLWYWLRTRAMRTPTQWALWGFMGGLMVEVYYLNALFLLIPLFDWIKVFRSPILNPPFSIIKEGAVFGVVLFLALMPHFIIKWVIHGSPWITGYEDQFFWNSPRLFELAFSSEHGFFLWTPVLPLAVAGLTLLWRRDRHVAGVLILTFLTFYYVVASYQNWHGQSSFGIRFFVSFTPVFVLGLAIFLEEAQVFLARLGRAQNRIFDLLPSALVAVFSLWNLGFIFQWGTNLVPNRGPVDFVVIARNQVTLVPGRSLGVFVRYLTEREQVMRELEQEDLIESREYRLRR